MFNASARPVSEPGALAHLVTINEDGSPTRQRSGSAWTATSWSRPSGRSLEKVGEYSTGPHVVLSFEAEGDNGIGMRNQLVVNGHARITEGDTPEPVSHLAQTYAGPGTPRHPGPILVRVRHPHHPRPCRWHGSLVWMELRPT